MRYEHANVTQRGRTWTEVMVMAAPGDLTPPQVSIGSYKVSGSTLYVWLLPHKLIECFLPMHAIIVTYFCI